MNLIGSYVVTADDDGRIVMPEDYLSAMGGRLILRPVEGEPFLLEVWSAELLARGGAPRAAALAMLLDGAVDAVADEAGRIAIPSGFLEGANRGDLVLCGNGDRLELWEADAWRDFCRQVMDDLASQDGTDHPLGSLDC